MKRYFLHKYGEMVEDKTGEFNDHKRMQQWVKHDDVERLREENAQLKELNREAIKLMNDFCSKVELPPPTQERFDEILTVLAKAEGEL